MRRGSMWEVDHDTCRKFAIGDVTSPRHGKGKTSIEMTAVGRSRVQKVMSRETGQPLFHHQNAFRFDSERLHRKTLATVFAKMEDSQILGKHGVEDNTEAINKKESIGRWKLDINHDIKEGPLEEGDGDDMMAVERGECPNSVSENNSSITGRQPYWRKKQHSVLERTKVCRQGSCPLQAQVVCTFSYIIRSHEITGKKKWENGQFAQSQHISSIQ
jgi:hypothetical protein